MVTFKVYSTVIFFSLHVFILLQTYTQPGKVVKERVEERALDEVGFMFVNKCIDALETRG